MLETVCIRCGKTRILSKKWKEKTEKGTDIIHEHKATSDNLRSRDFEVNKQYAYLTLGGNTALDQAFRKEYMNDYLQIEPVPNAVKHLNVYTTIIGDYIIRTHLPRQTAEQIATLYKNDMDENKFEEKLNEVFARPHKMKMQFSKRPEQARALRKKLSKPFYIPKEIRDRYELF